MDWFERRFEMLSHNYRVCQVSVVSYRSHFTRNRMQKIRSSLVWRILFFHRSKICQHRVGITHFKRLLFIGATRSLITIIIHETMGSRIEYLFNKDLLNDSIIDNHRISPRSFTNSLQVSIHSHTTCEFQFSIWKEFYFLEVPRI